ncbi:MAG: hypothetical protein LBQ10_10705 [Desulfovibrio sp.]|jgi:Meckel syndrome type 1 protein|nr:hypothetical protein [Desulfovibrio sp.]
MADPQNTNEDIIELTELIEKGDNATPADTVNNAAPHAKEEATGTALESLNDASTISPGGDIDSLLAQLDAGDNNETVTQPADQAEISADETGHIVDPHEKLDMSGMEEVDNLLSSLQIPLTPAQAGVPPQENAAAAQRAAPSSPADTPFDIDSLLHPDPVAAMDTFLEDAYPQVEENSGVEPAEPAPPRDESAAGAQTQEKTPAEVREISAELDDILAAAGEPDLPEEPSPQQPREEEDASLAAAPEAPPVEALSEEAQESPSSPADRLVEPPAQPAEPAHSWDESAAGAQTQEKTPTEVREISAELDDILAAADGSDLPEEPSPQQPREKEEASLAAAEEHPASRPPAEAPVDSSPAPIQDAQPAEVKAAAQEASPVEAPPEEAQESPSPLADRLQEVEHRLTALEKNMLETAETGSLLKTLEQRLDALESALPRKESPAPAGENAQALHAYMELAARLDGIETRVNAVAELATRADRMEIRLNAVAELATRVDDLEARLNAVAEQFESRVEKAAAAAAAKLLREEIARLLAS